MALGGNYGNTAGPGPSYFRAYIEIAISAKYDTYYTLKYKYSIRVVDGGSVNFGGSTCHKSWGGSVRLYGPGWYGDSGWINAGNYSSGQTLSLSCYAYYTGGSGRQYRSNCSASYTVPQLMTVPATPSNVLLSANSTGDILSGSWNLTATTSAPVTSQEIILIENNIEETPLTLEATLRDTSFAVTDDNKYAFKVRGINKIGNGAYGISNDVYTKPKTPNGYGLLLSNNNAKLQVFDNSKWGESFVWKQKPAGASTWTTISGATAATYDVANYAVGTQYQAFVLAPDGTPSNPCTISVKSNPQIFVNIPDGATMKAVYVQVPDGWTPPGGGSLVGPPIIKYTYLGAAGSSTTCYLNIALDTVAKYTSADITTVKIKSRTSSSAQYSAERSIAITDDMRMDANTIYIGQTGIDVVNRGSQALVQLVANNGQTSDWVDTGTLEV